jgi:hypothetical protein
MGIIKEPRDIDFIVDSRGLTTNEMEAIDIAIRKRKAKLQTQRVKTPTKKIDVKSIL